MSNEARAKRANPGSDQKMGTPAQRSSLVAQDSGSKRTPQTRPVDGHLSASAAPAVLSADDIKALQERMRQMGPRCKARHGSARCELPKGHEGRHNSEWGDF